MGLGLAAARPMAEALAEMAQGRAPVLWLQGLSCSGCSVSLLNSESITPDKLLTEYISLLFHQTLSAATGHTAVEAVNGAIERGGYVLVVEGAVPGSMPRACVFGEEPFPEQVLRAARKAKAVLAVGTCATNGGIPAAENNPTGAVGIAEYLASQHVDTPCILIPGCPPHPDWMVGTIAHLVGFGLPALDAAGRPKAFYAQTVHDQCPRYSDYERQKFASAFGQDGCLFKLGCVGPITHADCSLRAWNGGVNYCVRAGAPCIGCASPQFARKADFPIYTATGTAQ